MESATTLVKCILSLVQVILEIGVILLCYMNIDLDIDDYWRFILLQLQPTSVLWKSLIHGIRAHTVILGEDLLCHRIFIPHWPELFYQIRVHTQNLNPLAMISWGKHGIDAHFLFCCRNMISFIVLVASNCTCSLKVSFNLSFLLNSAAKCLFLVNSRYWLI